MTITLAEPAAQVRCYVAGPMTGYPDLNFPLFHKTTAQLRAQGHHVVNPAEINADPAAEWLDCMRADIKQLVDCNAILMLPGWEKSTGASLEFVIATALGMDVFYWPAGLNDKPLTPD